MIEYRGKTALITGASSGIGEAFARDLAGRGMALILVARSEDRLRSLAAELSAAHRVRAEVIPADLSLADAAGQVQQAVERLGLTVDLLINNAGFVNFGPFEEQAAEQLHQEVMVNVTALVDLTRAFLPAMLRRGSGSVINLASTAAFQPLPYVAVYGATKAFALSFSEALWAEYRQRGIRVLALCPGPTATAFFDRAGGADGIKTTPAQVVRTGLAALEKGRSYKVEGTGNYIMAQAGRLLPRPLLTLLTARMLKPRNKV